MWYIHRMTATTTVFCAALAVSIGAGVARADSTGGSINNNEKTLSGTVREPPPAEIERPGRHRPAAPTRRSSPQGASRSEGGVARYDGTWTAIFSAGCGGAGFVPVTFFWGRGRGLGFFGAVW